MFKEVLKAIRYEHKRKSICSHLHVKADNNFTLRYTSSCARTHCACASSEYGI